VANGHILKALAANAELHIVEAGGHLFLVSQAEKVAPIMKAFFDRGEVWADGAGDGVVARPARPARARPAKAPAARSRKPRSGDALATA
jgi:hypothetical protein